MYLFLFSQIRLCHSHYVPSYEKGLDQLIGCGGQNLVFSTDAATVARISMVCKGSIAIPSQAVWEYLASRNESGTGVIAKRIVDEFGHRCSAPMQVTVREYEAELHTKGKISSIAHQLLMSIVETKGRRFINSDVHGTTVTIVVEYQAMHNGSLKDLKILEKGRQLFLLVAYFQDLMHITAADVDLLDVHPGNLLYKILPYNGIMFTWNDFGVRSSHRNFKSWKLSSIGNKFAGKCLMYR